MLKKLLIKLTFSFLFLSSLSPLHSANLKHDPSEFLKPLTEEGDYVVAPPMITKAWHCHKRNITGKGTKVAVIDMSFHPDDIKALNKKGCILPSAIQNKLVLTSKEKPLTYNQFLKRFKGKRLNELGEHVMRRAYLDILTTFPLYHGSLVLQTVHGIAPGAQLLPIDLTCIGIKEDRMIIRPNFGEPIPEDRDAAERRQGNNMLIRHHISAFRKAIDAQVDAITVSCRCPDLGNQSLNSQYVNILKEASNKGIVITFSAGNDSTREKPVDTGCRLNETQALKELKGKGMLFCGALGYKKTGEEFLSDFSQHPSQDTLNHYVLAPGEKLFIYNPKVLLLQGTSFSAPITAGSVALMREHTKNRGLEYTSDDLLKILYHSGHDLDHDIPGTPFKTYKVLNLQNAMQHIDNKANLHTPAPAPQVKKPIRLNKRKVSAAKPMKRKASVAPKTKKRNLANVRKNRACTRASAKLAERRLANTRKAAKKAHVQCKKAARVTRKASQSQKRKTTKRIKK